MQHIMNTTLYMVSDTAYRGGFYRREDPRVSTCSGVRSASHRDYGSRSMLKDGSPSSNNINPVSARSIVDADGNTGKPIFNDEPRSTSCVGPRRKSALAISASGCRDNGHHSQTRRVQCKSAGYMSISRTLEGAIESEGLRVMIPNRII